MSDRSPLARSRDRRLDARRATIILAVLTLLVLCATSHGPFSFRESGTRFLS